MKKGIKKIVVLGLLAVFAAGCSLPSIAAAEIRFGILPRLSTMEMTSMFTPLADYLTKETGEKVSLVIPNDFDTFKSMAKAGQMDLLFANSIVYIQLKRDMPAIAPLALAAEAKAGTRFRGIIITRKDSGIEKLQDLKGKKLIFVDKDSAAGYIFQMLLLSKAGLVVQKDFITLPFAKKHDSVTLAVFNKAADAGGIREDDLDKMKERVDISQLRIVGYSDFFPNWPMFAASGLGREAAEKIKNALLRLKPNDPRAEQILGSAKLAGFTTIADSDYDQLRKAAKLAGAF
ncbi:MAG: phosphate/phosphite/phosphonate ABC transporter substrate-binding protein [Nitrospirota bacterium]